MKLVSKTETMIVIEDDGGFLNFIPVTPKVEQKELTPEEREALNKKLDELEIYWF